MLDLAAAVLDYRDVVPEHQIHIYCPRCATSLAHERDPVNKRIRPVCPHCGWIYYPTNPIGALIVIEADAGIVLVHPPSGTPAAPASLPGGRVEYGETAESAAVRLAREQTGFEVELIDELVHFLQPGTPFGPVLDFGFRAHAVAGSLRSDGPEGPAAIYPLERLPTIIPVGLRTNASWMPTSPADAGETGRMPRIPMLREPRRDPSTLVVRRPIEPIEAAHNPEVRVKSRPPLPQRGAPGNRASPLLAPDV